jgi:FAD/FMN-containing dehydrogenase
MPKKYPSPLDITEDTQVRAGFAKDKDTPNGVMPIAVARPTTAAELQALVQWANRSGSKVIPVSSTGPRRRGDTVPTTDNAVIADLSAMRRLVHVDPRDKIAIIEAGVDFGSIDALLAPHRLRAFRPLKPRAGKSLLASYLDREPLIHPNDHWDVADPFGGTAIVAGNGDLVLTGSAAVEGTLQEQLDNGSRQMAAYGPIHTDLLRVVQGSQGTLGAMAWAAVYCERIPAVEKSHFVTADSPEPILALARDLLLRRITSTLFIVDGLQLALLMARPGEDVAELAKACPAWTLFVTQAGTSLRPEQKLAWQVADLIACARGHGCTVREDVGGQGADDVAASLRTAPEGNFRDGMAGAHKELFFLQSFSGLSAILAAKNACLASHSGSGMGPVGTYIQPMAQGTFCHVEFTLPHLPEHSNTVAPGWQALTLACAQAGAFFSRPYGTWRELAYASDDSAHVMLTAAKTLLDAKDTMNPHRIPYKKAA